MIRFNHILSSAIVAAAVVAAPFAMADEPPAPAATMMMKKAGPAADPLDQHIAHLHDALKIAPNQEDAWKPVAKTIRANELAHRALVAQKQSNAETQSAVDDLNAYAEIAASHARATKKLAEVFATFYATLSDDQKKDADELFREHKHQLRNAATDAAPKQ